MYGCVNIYLVGSFVLCSKFLLLERCINTYIGIYVYIYIDEEVEYCLYFVFIMVHHTFN